MGINKIIFMLAILMVGVVGAVAIGSTYTQEQVDTIDVATFDLEEQFVRGNNNNINYSCKDKVCTVWVEILDITKEMIIREITIETVNQYINETTLEVTNETIYDTINETYWSGEWIIIYPQTEIKFRKSRWADIRDDTNATYAKQELINWLKNQRSRIVTKRRINLEKIQTQSEVDLSDVLNNLK